MAGNGGEWMAALAADCYQTATSGGGSNFDLF
jgi:hypothetical protein